MIDWLTFEAPFGPDCRVNGGNVFCIDRDGSIEWGRERWLSVPGSYSSSLDVRTDGEFLWVSGNPVKWFQGHNLFGTDDVRGLAACTVEAVCAAAGLPVLEEDRAAWRRGFIRLTRVDCTQMYDLGSVANVNATLRAASASSRTRHGTAVVKGETVYWGKSSRRWTIKAYGKHQELHAKGKGHGLPAELLHRGRLLEFAEPMLRVELTLRSPELRKRGLSMTRGWKGDTPMEQLGVALESMQVSEHFELPSDVLERLPGRLVGAYTAWREGLDLRAVYTRATYYRYRKELLERGIDISLAPDGVVFEPYGVAVPFTQVVKVTVAQVPEWARGTELYFEPSEKLVG